MSRPEKGRSQAGRGWALAVLLVLAAGVAGRWKGAADARGSVGVSTMPPAEGSALSGTPPPRPQDAGRAAREHAPIPLSKDACAILRKRVLFLAQHVPSATEDWDWRAETQSVLAQLPEEELAAVFADIDKYWHINESELAREVLHYWILKNPSAALIAADRHSGNSALSREAFIDWSREHPAEALAWAESKAALGESLDESRKNFGRELLCALPLRDPDLAARHYRTLEPAEAARIMADWGYRYGSDPAQRERMLALASATGRREDLDQLNAALMHSWGEVDPVAARGYLDRLDLPPAQRLEMDASLTVAGTGRDHQAALSGWVQRHGDLQTAPAEISCAMSIWMTEDSSAAVKWLAQQPSGAQLDQISLDSVKDLSDRGRFPEASRLIDPISDPEAKRQATEILDARWSDADPAAAEEWRGSREPAAGGAPR